MALAPRQAFLIGALAGAAACGAALAVMGSEFDARLAPNWSQWKPAGSDMLVGAEDIAQHVDDGDEPVRIETSGLEHDGLPLSIAIRGTGGAIEFLDGDGLIYRLRGPAEPSRAGERRLRRTALELALYTFRYLDDATMVAVLMPPTDEAVFFRPGDLLRQLQVPLAATIPKPLSPADVARIDSLTLRNVFIADFERTDESTYLLLSEP